LAEFFWLIVGEHLLIMRDKLCNEENMTHACQSKVIETNLEPLEAQMWIEQEEAELYFCSVFSEPSYFTQINAETSPKAQNIKLKPVPSSLRDEFLNPNKTYLVFVNINLDPAQIESVVIFYLKINTFNHVSYEPFENFWKHILSAWHENSWENYDAVAGHKLKIKRATWDEMEPPTGPHTKFWKFFKLLMLYFMNGNH
jgi:hypothetical protein